jgi:outer membrane cobalamin receptor
MKQLTILLVFLSVAQVHAGLIHGHVRDADSGLPLPGAIIVVVDTTLGTIADEEGRYNLELSAGTWALEFSYIGYASSRPAPLTLTDDSSLALDVALHARAIPLREMTITPGRFAIMGDVTGARQTLSEEEIQSIPQFGEDIFRAVTRLPGVSGSDFSARFNVRGGEQEEVLVRVDGVELFDPFHLKDIEGGALSIVDVALIEGVDLLTGGYPAEYGDRLSGVFDVKTRTPEPGGSHATLGLSMMNTRALIEGASESSSWLVSARRGYLDLVLSLMGEDEEIRPKYGDVFAKFTRQLDDRHQLQTSLLHSRDDFDLSEDDNDESNTGYYNTYAWLTLQSTMSASLVARTTLSGGRITHSRDGLAFFGDSPEVDFTVRDERDFDFFSLRQDWRLDRGDVHYLKLGYDVRRQDVSYDYVSEQRLYFRDSAGTVRSRLDTTDVTRGLQSTSVGMYAADRIRITDPVTAEVGLRYDTAGHTHDDLWSPRFNVVYQLASQSFLRAGWGRFYQTQGIDQLEVAEGEREFHKAELAEHTVLGLEHLFSNDIHLRLEAYRKDLSSLRPEYRNWRNDIEFFPELQDDRIRVALDGARSHGVEFYLKRDSGGPFTWWASYAMAQVDDDVSTITAHGSDFEIDEQVPSRFDQRHTLNVDVNYRRNHRWRLNLAWQYRTGWPYTDQFLRLGQAADGSDFYYTELGEPNGANAPAFHRLDMRLNRSFATSKGRVHAFLELTNVYNHGNVRGYEYNFDCSDAATPNCHYRKSPDYWFKLLPSLGVTWDWDL